jgi:predicted nucleotidyltransferase
MIVSQPFEKSSSDDRPTTLGDLLAVLRPYQPMLRKRYGIRSLGVFGSYVRGDANHQSDLDILVEYERPPTLFEFVRLQNQLSDIVGVQVDLVMKSTLKPKIGERILAEVVAL